MPPRPAIPALAAAAVTGVVLAARWAAIRRGRRRGGAPSGAGPAGARPAPGPAGPAAGEASEPSGTRETQEAPETRGAPEAPDVSETPAGPGDGGAHKDAHTGGQTIEDLGQELRRYWNRLRPFYPDDRHRE